MGDTINSTHMMGSRSGRLTVNCLETCAVEKKSFKISSHTELSIQAHSELFENGQEKNRRKSPDNSPVEGNLLGLIRANISMAGMLK